MKRLEDHESFEMAFLNLLASKRLTGVLVFGGGTMLRLCQEVEMNCLIQRRISSSHRGYRDRRGGSENTYLGELSRSLFLTRLISLPRSSLMVV